MLPKRSARLKAGGSARKKKKASKPPSGQHMDWMKDPRSRQRENGQQILRGVDKSNRRREIFERSGGRCEAKRKVVSFAKVTAKNKEWIDFVPILTAVRCNRPITESTGEWSHQPCKHLGVGSGHGQGFKCDAMECGIASCKECHQRQHQSL